VQFLAAAAGATCYADPFYAAARTGATKHPAEPNFIQRLLQRVARHQTTKSDPVA